MKLSLSIPGSRWKELAVLTTLLLVGLLLRLYKIDNPLADWHSWRQADTAAVSRNFLRSGIDLLHPKFDDISNIPSGLDNPQGYRFVEFPLFNVIHALVAYQFPSLRFETIGRLIAVFVSLISILLLYRVSKKVTDTNTAIVTTLIFTLLPFNVYYSRVILPEPILITLSLFVLDSFLTYRKGAGPIPALRLLVACSLLLLFKAYMAVFFIPPVITLLREHGHRSPEFKRLLIILFMSFIPFLLWFVWARQFPEGIPHFSWAFNGDHIRFKPSFFYWIFGIRIGQLILGSWGTVLLAFGIKNFYKESNDFTLIWAFSVVVYLMIVATANVRHDYYQAITTPILSLLVAKGIISLWSSVLGKLSALFCLTLMLLVGWEQIRGYYQINHPEIVEAGRFADSTLPSDAVVIAPYNGDTAFLYHINRKGYPYVTLPIAELIAKGATHYVSVNFDSQTSNFMNKYTQIARTSKFVILDLKSPLPTPKTPLP